MAKKVKKRLMRQGITATDYVYAYLTNDGELVLSSNDMCQNENVFHDFGQCELTNRRNGMPLAWHDYAKKIVSVKFAEIVRPTTCYKWFQDLEYLTEVKDIKNLDTVLADDFSYMFLNCKRLKNLNVSGFRTNSCKYMEETFEECKSLTALDVSKWNMKQVRSVQGMFMNCKNLTSIDVSSWHTSKVRDFSFLFAGCKKLKTINASSFNVRKGKSFYGMFINCEKLTMLDLNTWDMENACLVSGMFSDCKKLKTLLISKWKLENAEDTHCMFFGCKSLKLLDITNWTLDNLKFYLDMFQNCNLTTFTCKSNTYTKIKDVVPNTAIINFA